MRWNASWAVALLSALVVGCGSGSSGGGSGSVASSAASAVTPTAPTTTTSAPTATTSTPTTPSAPTAASTAPGSTAAAPPPKAAALTGDPRLQKGDSGDSVRILQDLINESRRRDGLAAITADGDFGPRTETAVLDFQRTHGAPKTGVSDQPFWAALHPIVALGPLGTIDPLAGRTLADAYTHATSRADVAIHELPEIEITPGVRANPLVANSGMSIDADGDGDAWKSDPSGQPSTSLQSASGKSLNPTITPYFVLPGGFTTKHPGVKLGDIAAVIYKGQVCYAIFGDIGPKTRLGEGSIALAKALGINASPTSGGTSAGVFYVVFPRSGSGAPLSNAEIAKRGSDLLKKAGGRP